jgi:hypothetical protein
LRDGTTIILSRNDLEADEIARVALADDCEVIDLGLTWAQLPDFSLARVDVSSLPARVILVECPSPEFEDRLRRTGRTVHIVDHHLRSLSSGEVIDRRSPRTSLEQVLQLLGSPVMTPEQQLISANDAGYWPGLIAAVDLATPLSSEPDVLERTRVRNLAILAEARRIRALELGRTLAETTDEKVQAGEAVLNSAEASFRRAINAGDVVRLTPRRYSARNEGELLIVVWN